MHPNPPLPLPGPPGVKQFPVDGNFKTRIAGQLREEAGPCPDHILLIPENETSLCREAPWRSKGE